MRNVSNLVFESRDEWDEEYCYCAVGGGCRFYFYCDRVEFRFPADDGQANLALRFVDANQDIDIQLDDEHQVTYKEVWNGIDLIFSGNDEQLKYDVVVYPGACIDDICLRYEGGDTVSVDMNGDLFVHTHLGILREGKPVSYQWTEEGRKVIATQFQQNPDETIGFHIEQGAYDPSAVIVIDPVVFYSTYLGGSGVDEATSVV
ncbi:hypothetical protein [Mechercharimyces sp. CAU 1602]|uniref:DUF7948 domain-containing protein n=1 Tax=Mechercharimyces sp. CAU 1602 TaxID=2973933 RepID=UPI002161ADBB|nr:hypothetical protein [Mechercharimyces sp. CAU 1602]MCS1350053.1 hypothetical protein [Mechercharimyces sp. CAU 1602]